MLDFPLEELDVGRARLALVIARQRQHVVGHVEAVGLAGRADAARRQQNVDAPARAEVEHRLALFQFGKSGRIAAAERRQHRLFRQGAGFVVGVQIGGDGLAPASAPPSPQAEPQHEPGARTLRAASA